MLISVNISGLPKGARKYALHVHVYGISDTSDDTTISN